MISKLSLALSTPVLAVAWLLPLLAAEPAGVHVQESSRGHDHFIDFFSADALVGRYHYWAPDQAKPYLWPLKGPGRFDMTRAWPMEKGQPGESTDHPHQKSVWFCHGDVFPEGIELKNKIKGVEGVDFWSEAKGHGCIVYDQPDPLKSDRNHGRVTTHNVWRTSDGQPVLHETRTIHLHDFGDTRLFVFEIDLHADVVPITFGDTKEGSFGVRVSDQITEKNGKGKIENAEGKIGKENCWGQLAPWCDYSGPIAGKTAGLAIFDDPKNPYPACWHSRDYGLMAANPFGRAKSGFPAMKGRSDLVKLAKDEHLKLRYGLLIHPGDAKEGKVAEYFERFSKLER